MATVGEFKLLQVSDEAEQWSGNDGKLMATFEVEFAGDQASGFANVTKLAAGKRPEVGEVYDEYIPPQGNKKARLKKSFNPAARGQSSLSASDTEREFRTKEQIMRSYAHGQALQWIAVKAQIGKLEKLEWDEYLRYVDQFYNDVKDAA